MTEREEKEDRSMKVQRTCLRGLRGCRGSMLTETAIFLPVFIISVLALSLLIKAVWVQVSVFETLADEARKSSVKAYVFEKSAERLPGELVGFAADAASRQVFLHAARSGLGKRGLDESCLKIKEYGSCGSDGAPADGDLMRAETEFDLKLNLPAPVRGIQIGNVIYWRIWNGKDASGEVFSFERMTRDESGDIVYIFPDSGNKFHQRSCRYVNSYAQETRATREILEEYGPCPLCMESEASTGENVYIFRYGNSYHRKDCKSVSKYVISMDRTDAEAKNYTPCIVCGG